MKRTQNRPGHILIVDDEEGIRFALSSIFESEGYTVSTAGDRSTAVEQVRSSVPDIVLLDLRLKGEDGVDLLNEFRSIRSDIPIIMITGHGSIGSSVEAMKCGAVDYILKPIDRTTILKAVEKNIEIRSLRKENTFLKTELRKTLGVRKIHTTDPVVKSVIKVADKVKDTGASVLITGESGSGKEILARYLHYTSIRRNANFIGINCAALSDSLLLSELFGHEKGAFTGAVEQRPGKFELANEGTLFLDEIGDMSLDIQSKILRILEERSFERVGGIRPIHVDVRVIAAANRPLEMLIANGRFRADLYYRLKVITCHLPPLRERLNDIPLLVEAFIDLYNVRYNKAIRSVDSSLMDRLQEHKWPGNIRELQNLINQAVLLSEGDHISALPGFEGWSRKAGSNLSPPEHQVTGLKEASNQYSSYYEIDMIEKALEKYGGNKSRAAQSLEISRKTLARKMTKYEIGEESAP